MEILEKVRENREKCLKTFLVFSLLRFLKSSRKPKNIDFVKC